MNKREPYPTKAILLRTEQQRDLAVNALRNAPLDDANPLQFMLREKPKVRGMDANARMWVGPLADISEQGYVGGRTYSAEVWHEQFKREFLPEEFDPALCMDGYRKWDYTPNGDRVLIGSTTKLTKAGFAQYMTQVEAFGAELGVRFSAPRKDIPEYARAA